MTGRNEGKKGLLRTAAAVLLCAFVLLAAALPTGAQEDAADTEAAQEDAAQGFAAPENNATVSDKTSKAFALPETHRTVRVAFPSQGNMGEVGEGGDLVGYNYSYMQELAEYAGWNIEYITYEDQTADEGIMSAMEMVLSGEADLIGPLLRSEAVEEMFSFPKSNYGVVYTTLCALEKSTTTAVNFTRFVPLRVAVYAGAEQRNREVAEYLDRMGLAYELIPCEDTDAQLAMLETGEADVLSSITLSYFEGTRTVAQFAPRPYYWVTTKGNETLMAELDAATEKLNYTRPHLQEQLQNEFFGDTSGGYILSADEQDYMETHHTLKVLCAASYEPYSGRGADGEAKGLLVYLLNDFAKQNNITVEYTFGDTAYATDAAWKTGEYDCMIGLPATSKYCVENELLRSNSVVTVGMVVFGKLQNAKPYEEGTIAVYSSLGDLTYLNAFREVLLCDTLEGCFEALQDGRADYVCANRLSVDYEQYSLGAGYASTPLLGEEIEACVYVARTMDARFLAALNKYIYTLSDSTKTTYLSRAGRHDEPRSLKMLVQENPVRAAGLLTATGLLLCGCILFALNAHKNKVRSLALEKANKTMQQANDAMLEANAAMRRAGAAKSEFLSRMSHDIRTPMNAILGFTTLAKQDVAAPALLEEDLDRISASGEFLLGLVNDILDMSKIENHAMELRPAPYPRAAFKNQIETLLTPLCAAKHIAFTAEFSDDMPECLNVDKLRVNQIFFNLLSNAVKFTPENGRVDISGRVLSRAGGTVRLCITVRDSGIGMSEEFQKRMFDTFSQEMRQETGGQGTGLGLSIVKSLVELMHGTLRVNSAPGKGSTFTVELDAEECAVPKPEPAVDAVQSGNLLQGKRILLCEDHPLNAQLASRLLTKVGARVVCAANGEEGLACFEASPVEGAESFDLILMDVRMPVMDGLEATRRIRALDRADAKRIPIVAMTANAFEEDAQNCLRAGMNAHLAKPFDVKMLYATLLRQQKQE